MENAVIAPCAGCGAPANDAHAADGIGRRTFLVQSALLAAAAALAACGGMDATAPNLAAGTQIRVGDYPTLATTGGIALVDVSNALLAVVRTGSSTFVVLSRVCPHQGSIVGQNG